MTTLREKILDSKPRRKTALFCGQEVALIEPTIEEIMQKQDEMSEDRLEASIKMIVRYVVDPDTGEKLFTDHDCEALKQLPAGQVAPVIKAMSELMGLDEGGLVTTIEDAKKSATE